MNKTSYNKAPGPDNIQNELIKSLDSENKKQLLHLYNVWNNNRTVDHTSAEAIVVTLFKKGNTEELGNYRPISLLNAVFKIYCAMIKNRIEAQIERFLNRTQYGFRKGRSCSQALHLIRRILDIGESTNKNIILVFLDWEKAFDKINHQRLFQALKRIGINEHYLQVIENLYLNPCFKTKSEQQTSSTKKQSAGIRQGCTLSPYLFLIVMTILFHDVHYNIPSWANTSNIDGTSFTEVLFADDTTLLTSNTKAMHKILHEIEKQSAYYGLNLNKKKCAYFAINKNNNIKFTNGEPVVKVTSQTYLGALLTSDAEIREEITTRIAKANQCFYRLKLFWKKTNCTTSWKLQVYDSIIKAITLYGLETTHITKAQIDRLHAMHTKGLRIILNLTHSFIDRTTTNEKIWQTAKNKIKDDKQPYADIFTFESTLKHKRITFLGHLLRANNYDPLRMITFQPSTAKPISILNRRVGGPKKHWTWDIF